MAKIALLFPGQGVQYVGMGKDLVEQYSEARHVFEEADDALGMGLGELCFSGTEEQLNLTANTQPAVVAASLACLAVLQKRAPEPYAYAGLSLGEYSALVAAKSLDCGTAVGLVRKRGQYMQEVVPPGQGAMVAIIGLERSKVVTICAEASDHGVVEPANFNCPGQVVISGQRGAVLRAGELAKAAGAKRVLELPVSAPFHSSLLKPAGEKMAQELAKTNLDDALKPVVANVNAHYLTKAPEITGALVKQVSNPVLWEETLLKLAEDGVDTFIEVGPGKALTGFVKKTVTGATALNVSDAASLTKTLDHLEEVG